MKFPKAVMQNLADGYDLDGFKVLEDEIEDTGRWHSEHRIVFSAPDGKLYSSRYRTALTEYQCEVPYEDDPSEIEVYEVERFEVRVVKYRRVKSTT